MKLLLAALLCLLTLPSAHAQAWPRNPQTGRVEFRGVLPWPASAKTEAQRRALVRRWYLAKLTDESVTVVEQQARTVVSPTLLTYAGLPISVLLGKPDRLVYIASLNSTSSGLKYTLGEFHFSLAKDVAFGSDLEQVLAADSAADRPVLATLRKRLASAVASW